MAALGHTRRELAEAFDGLTAYLRSPATGLWTAPDGRQERDDVVMVEVVTDTFDRAWWRRYATRRPNDAQPWSRTNLADWFNRGLHARHLHGCLQRHESVCRFVFLCIESRAERRRRHGDVPHARWRDSTPPGISVRGEDTARDYTRTEAAARARALSHILGANRRLGGKTRAAAPSTTRRHAQPPAHRPN